MEQVLKLILVKTWYNSYDVMGLEKQNKPGYSLISYGPPGTENTDCRVAGQNDRHRSIPSGSLMIVSKYTLRKPKTYPKYLIWRNMYLILFFDEAMPLGKRTVTSSSNY
jgi:hypothetical protein